MSGNGGGNEGASSTRPPLLTGLNYAFWKGKMESYICQIHDRAWMAVEDGYTPPMMTPTGGGEDVLKPKVQWNATANEAWDILEVAHEGTKVVKDSKLQVLQTQFGMLRMDENKCFNNFEIKLMDIVNQSHQLGDPYSDRRIKQKIMRSLPERVKSKVMALEENSGYKDMKPSEVIGRLLAYESRKGPTSTPSKKQKGIALKASKVEKEEKDDSDEDMTLLMRRFKKFAKFEKKGFGSKGLDLKKKTHFKKFEPRQERIKRKVIKCFKCGGIRYITLDCGNLKNKKGKVMAATWSVSDDSDESNETSDDEDLIAKKMDIHDYIVKFESSRLKNKRKIRRLKEENLELSTQIDHLSEEVVRTIENEDKLRKELDLSKRSEEGMKRELEDARELMAKMGSSTKKLDHMLDVGKRPSDKRGCKDSLMLIGLFRGQTTIGVLCKGSLRFGIHV
ncbi:hypothetical protein Q3G72_013070 [Acer saccharum]|nr:hypothetical protein Q3G72_013070 [Acer saccharum]